MYDLALLRDSYEKVLIGKRRPLYICCNYTVEGPSLDKDSVLDELKTIGFEPSKVIIDFQIGDRKVNLGVWLDREDLERYRPEILNQMFDINFVAISFM